MIKKSFNITKYRDQAKTQFYTPNDAGRLQYGKGNEVKFIEHPNQPYSMVKSEEEYYKAP